MGCLCYEQNNIVKSVRVDDWPAEWTIIANNGRKFQHTKRLHCICVTRRDRISAICCGFQILTDHSCVVVKRWSGRQCDEANSWIDRARDWGVRNSADGECDGATSARCLLASQRGEGSGESTLLPGGDLITRGGHLPRNYDVCHGRCSWNTLRGEMNKMLENRYSKVLHELVLLESHWFSSYTWFWFYVLDGILTHSSLIK